jgi:surface protein
MQVRRTQIVGNLAKSEEVVGSMVEEPNEVALMTSILSQLSKADDSTRDRIIKTIATFYGVNLRATTSGERFATSSSTSMTQPSFSEDRSISPKQFMFEKQPKTDVERVACLAYYLTHYRDCPHFKTLDISKLNTESAQIKMSNPTVAVDNAVKRSYLVPATKGNKQLSALGEQFVQALPDREKAHGIMVSGRPRRRSRKADEAKEA